MADFEHSGHLYRIKKLNAIEQWHVNRRIAPLVPKLVPAFIRVSQISASDKKGAILKDAAVLSQLIAPFADGLAAMSNEDSEYVLNMCLSAISREVTPGTWAKVWMPSAKISQFEELNEITNLLPLVMRVIWDSLGPFISALLTAKESSEAAESTPDSN